MRDWPADLVEIVNGTRNLIQFRHLGSDTGSVFTCRRQRFLSPQLSRLRHLDEQLCAEEISELRETVSPARTSSPGVTYYGWLWDTRRGPRTPLARFALSWSAAAASSPSSNRRGGRAARWSWCAAGPGLVRAA